MTILLFVFYLLSFIYSFIRAWALEFTQHKCKFNEQENKKKKKKIHTITINLMLNKYL